MHDKDQDGYLSREEYAALRADCRERRDTHGRPRCDPARLLEFDVLDSNREGRVGEDELVETLARRYRGDGSGWRGEGRPSDTSTSTRNRR